MALYYIIVILIILYFIKRILKRKKENKNPFGAEVKFNGEKIFKKVKLQEQIVIV